MVRDHRNIALWDASTLTVGTSWGRNPWWMEGIHESLRYENMSTTSKTV